MNKDYTDKDIEARIPDGSQARNLNAVYKSQKKDSLKAAVFHSATLDPRAEHLFGLMLQPRFEHKTFAELCHMANLSLFNVVQFVRSYKLAQFMMEALDDTGALFRETVEDAYAKQITCPRCEGEGAILAPTESDETATKVCPACGGEKKVRVPGDKDSRTQVFEATGLLPTKNTILQQNTYNAPVAQFSGREDLLAKMDGVLDEGVIDVTPEEDESTNPQD